MTNCVLDYIVRVLPNQAGFQKTTRSMIDFANVSPAIKLLLVSLVKFSRLFIIDICSISTRLN